jgi:hypothetical protein
MASKDLIDFPYRFVFENPVRLTDIRSWHGHIPFAFFLVQATRPKKVVELGVHRGDSYCAFCQAIRDLSIDCKCFGIDTWEGDPQSRFYDEEVFEEFNQFHDSHFAGFSKLIRSTFDEALVQFSNHSIDILHIDGFHVYEAVKRDFESWLPKMSKSGIILFHDIEVRTGDFGVWKLWEEVSLGRHSFEFYHSHGLGVLLAGDIMPEKLKPLFLGTKKDLELIRKFFSKLGNYILLKEQLEEST